MKHKIKRNEITKSMIPDVTHEGMIAFLSNDSR